MCLTADPERRVKNASELLKIIEAHPVEEVFQEHPPVEKKPAPDDSPDAYDGPTEPPVKVLNSEPSEKSKKEKKRSDLYTRRRSGHAWIWWLMGSLIVGGTAATLWFSKSDILNFFTGKDKPGVKTVQDIPTIEMVYVEGGTFRMGSNDGDSDEKPVHTVTVDGFYIGKYEVTVSQYLQFAKETNSHYPEWLESGSVYNIYHGTDNHYKKFGSALTNENHPIIGISWHDAKAYCEWLSRKTGMKYRLPTEAQWEFAARGGNKSRGYIYSGSYTIGEVAWYTENSNGKTHPVGQKKANELGIYDMSGNVWEWCADWYAGDYYADSPRYNPENKTQTSGRVGRGGGWFSYPGYCRVADRGSWGPGNRGVYVGFRLLRME